MILIRSILLTVFFIISGSMYSQTASTSVTMTLPIVTLVGIEPSGNITLNFTAPASAGNALEVSSPDTSKWINYTSAIASGGLSRRITASISKLIPGVNIKLQVAAATGAGGGTLGTSSGQVILTTTPVTIINGIGGAYTGNGSNNGHAITLSLATNTYASLEAQTSTPVVITYTITE